MLYQVVNGLSRGLLRRLFGLESRGVEHIPSSGPLLIAANHSSFLDPPIVSGASPRQLHFLAKAELFRIPLLGGLIHGLNARPVRRDGSDPVALRTALRILGDRGALLIFPEGTRGEEGVLREARPGAGMLAMLSGAPVVPALITGSGQALPRGRWLPRPAKIRVSFGPPLSFAAGDRAGRRGRAVETSRAIMTAIARLRQESDGARTAGLSTVEMGHASGDKR
ncbi:MAG: lysophospholipid acyltransferase family protein [Candidatus Methylomirabilia bacterium]